MHFEKFMAWCCSRELPPSQSVSLSLTLSLVFLMEFHKCLLIYKQSFLFPACQSTSVDTYQLWWLSQSKRIYKPPPASSKKNSVKFRVGSNWCWSKAVKHTPTSIHIIEYMPWMQKQKHWSFLQEYTRNPETILNSVIYTNAAAKAC